VVAIAVLAAEEGREETPEVRIRVRVRVRVRVRAKFLFRNQIDKNGK
jgi:hypothetical protein